MTTRLIEWAIANRRFVLLLVVILIGSGVIAMNRLPIDAIPDVTNVQVQIVTSSPALGPVEAAMSGLPDINELRSISRYGISSVTVVFKDGTPLFFARQLVQERLTAARENIPPGFGSPKMVPPTTGLGEVYHFTVEGEGYSPMELRNLLDWQIAFRLRQVPGVVEVNAWSGAFEQLERGRERLLIVVPIARFAIFAMLYAAFRSVRSALLIFTGIPLAAVGGVLALWIRQIPFSIFSGVGFIALFGVAVLNGVVMVSAIRRLQTEGYNLTEAVEVGALERLRPC